MDFDFSDDQKMLRDQTRKFLESKCTLAELRKVFEGDEPHDRATWAGLAELGLMGADIPEQYGGLGLGTLELCVVAEELGRALAPVPFSSSIYLASQAIQLAAPEEIKKKWLPLLASGKAIGTFALAEGAAQPITTKMKTRFDGKNLNGEKSPVPDGSTADIAIVGAQSADGFVLTFAELKDSARKQINTVDPTRDHAAITFKNTPATLLTSDAHHNGEDLLNHLLDHAAVLFSFEQLGGADAALDFARDYASQRYAFGRPIGSFQAIKHKLADAYVRNQIARSNCYYAAMALANDDPDLSAAAAGARLAASDAFVYAAQENVQTHGGVGFTWESDCQFFYRRAKLLALTIGGTRRWQERLVAALEKRNVA